MAWEPLDAPLWSPRPLRGYREDWERSRNMDGTVPTKEAHYWVSQVCESFPNACTVHPACGRTRIRYDDMRRLVQSAEAPLCEECSGWAAQRMLAGYPFEKGALA